MNLQNFKDLGKRLIVSAIVIAITASLIIFSQISFVKFLLAFVVVLLSFLAIGEYLNIAAKKNLLLSKNILISGGIIIPLLFFLSSQISGFAILIFLSFFLIIALLFYFRFKEMEGSLSYIGVSSFGLFYITIPLGLIFLILYQENGRLWLSYALIVTKITDIGGYFGGKAFGRRPLCLVSPKKTKEGAIIGFLCAVVFSYLFTILANNYGFGLNPLISIIIGGFLGVFGQLGDLSESLLKRDAGIKDSSNIPGLGGILDMLDSLLFNIPIVWIIIEALK